MNRIHVTSKHESKKNIVSVTSNKILEYIRDKLEIMNKFVINNDINNK